VLLWKEKLCAVVKENKSKKEGKGIFGSCGTDNSFGCISQRVCKQAVPSALIFAYAFIYQGSLLDQTTYSANGQ
jgi:hypothetical protein